MASEKTAKSKFKLFGEKEPSGGSTTRCCFAQEWVNRILLAYKPGFLTEKFHGEQSFPGAKFREDFKVRRRPFLSGQEAHGQMLLQLHASIMLRDGSGTFACVCKLWRREKPGEKD